MRRIEVEVSYFEIDPKHNLVFPRHGWIKGTNGIRFLRLPIVRLYQVGGPTHERFLQKELAGTWIQFRSPYRTLRQLAIGLRDLHREILVQLPLLQADWMHRAPSVERDNAFTRSREGNESIEISLIAIFVLLRRLADELINASAPFLFEHSMSAPRKMATAVAQAKEGTLARWKPTCNLSVLTDALLNHTGWLMQLREGGIRDTLVHAPHFLQVGGQGSRVQGASETSWRVNATLAIGNFPNIQSTELLGALRECIAGACKFMELLFACVEPSQAYTQGDCVVLTGADNDVVGFWPPILQEAVDFPLLT